MSDQTTRAVSRRRFLGSMASGVTGAGIVGLGATGCRFTSGAKSQGSSKSLRGSIWGTSAAANDYKTSFQLFQESHAGVQVSLDVSPLSAYYDKLNTRIAGGAAPEIFQVHIATLATYASRGAARVLDEFIPDPLPFDKLDKNVFQAAKINNKTYYVPLGLAVQPAVVFNHSMLQRLGLPDPKKAWTLADYQDFGRAVTTASKGKVYVGDQGGDSAWFEAYLRGAEKNLFTAGGKLGFEEADVLAWLTYWDQLRRGKLCPPMAITSATTGMADSPYVKNTVAVTGVASDKGAVNLQAVSKDEARFASFPRRTSSGPAGPLVTPMGQFAISAKIDDDKARLAAELCAFLVTDPAAVEQQGLIQGVPLFTDLRTKLYDQSKGVKKKIFEDVQGLIKEGFAPRNPYPPHGDTAMQALGDANQNVGFNKIKLDAAAAGVMTEAKKQLAAD